MKLVITLIIFVLTIAQADNSNDHRWVDEYNFNGKKYTTILDEQSYKKMKIWDMNKSENPPVSALEALKLCKERIQKIKIPEGFYWKLIGVSLKPLNLQDRKWIWIVHYRYAFRSGTTGAWPRMAFVVTMDGKLIEPKIKNE